MTPDDTIADLRHRLEAADLRSQTFCEEAQREYRARVAAESRLVVLEQALREAGEAIHSEYCGSTHHHAVCEAVDAALSPKEPR